MGFDVFDSFMFNIFPIFFLLIFTSIFGLFIFTIISNVKVAKKNNRSPRIIVPATLINKRMDVRRRNHDQHHSSSSYYYLTFELESSDRIEFQVSGKESGLLVEGDYGKLTFQGTRYLSFERIID